MLEAGLVNRTIAAVMRTGADLAEIFAEDRCSPSAGRGSGHGGVRVLYPQRPSSREVVVTPLRRVVNG